MSQADTIRAYVHKAYIEPARKAGRTQVIVGADQVHKDLRLNARFPLVCSALDAKKFQDDYRVLLSSRTGPLQGSTVKWTFSLKK